jgi:hypothetical protein
MRRPILVLAALAAAVLAVRTDRIAAARSPACTRGQTDIERDPRGLLPLSDMNPIGASAAAALRYEQKASRPQVRAATFAIADRERGAEAKYSCGVRVWRRTIVVYVLDRAMLPAQSASQRVYFVGRFNGGYQVWQVVH